MKLKKYCSFAFQINTKMYNYYSQIKKSTYVVSLKPRGN